MSFFYGAARLRLTLSLFALAWGSFAYAENRHDAKTQQIFQTMVVVGDSLSAGFQNFSLFDSSVVVPGFPTQPLGGQKQGYAALVAKQAGASLVQPLISYPGVPPALSLNAGQITRGTITGARENPGVQAYNLSVPGFTVADALAHPFPGDSTNAIDAMSDLVQGLPGAIGVPVPLGCGPLPAAVLPPMSTPSAFGVSEVACAIGLQPSIILVSIGNNDALQALTLGIPPTPAGAFATQFAALIGALSLTGAKLVVSNVPDVSVVPYLVPVPAFTALCGAPPLGAKDSDFVVLDITNPTPTSFNLCTNYVVRPKALIDSAKASVSAYNIIIQTLTQLNHGVLVDVNGLLNQIAQNGYNAGGHNLTTAYMGGIFSLDAIHPTNTGYAILANEVIKTMNRQLGTVVPPLSIEQVAATDPLVPPKH